MEIDLGLFTEIIKYTKLDTIKSLLMCCKQYNEYQNIIALLKELKHMILIENFKITVANAAENGHINILNWFHKSRYEFKYSEYAINYAARNCHINVLEWFHNSKYEFKYSEAAVDWASENGHINVLEWFHNSQYEFKYSKDAINWASENGHINVLEWFYNSDYKFKYSSIGNNEEIIKWFNDNGYKK
jgi:hypothetical protein